MLEHIINAGSKIIGGIISDNAQSKNVEKQLAAQREFAQQGVQWKVADAKKAGVHPLYALGAQTHSFAPMSIGASGLGSAVSSMGQDIGRAVAATSPAAARAADAQIRLIEAQARNLELQNMGQAVRQVAPSQVGPAFPSVDTGVPLPRARPPEAGAYGLGVIDTFGRRIDTRPDRSATQKVSDQYGEIVGEAHGIESFVHAVSMQAAMEYQRMLDAFYRGPSASSLRRSHKLGRR